MKAYIVTQEHWDTMENYDPIYEKLIGVFIGPDARQKAVKLSLTIIPGRQEHHGVSGFFPRWRIKETEVL